MPRLPSNLPQAGSQGKTALVWPVKHDGETWEVRSRKILMRGYGDWWRAAAFMALSRSVAMRDLAM